MVLSRHHNAGHNRYLFTAYKSFENVARFKYFGTKVTNENLIHEEIRSRLNSGNACSHSVNLKIEIYNTIILPVVLYGCGT